ncbi:MAG: hypothetical protein RCG15_04390 [Candidatus Rickettsia vulgarisii]
MKQYNGGHLLNKKEYEFKIHRLSDYYSSKKKPFIGFLTRENDSDRE